MSIAKDFAQAAQSLRRSMWRHSGKFHRTRLLATGTYIKTTASRRARP